MASTFKFRAIEDDGEFFVVDGRCGAYSFAHVVEAVDGARLNGGYMFNTMREAAGAAAELNSKAIEADRVRTRMMNTSARFEAVADTKYGPAWE